MNSKKKTNFKVIIAGSRGFSNYKLLKETCDDFLRNIKKEYNIVIISGGARGADKAGEKYASDEDLDLEIYPADWKKYGKSAGFMRNEQMADIADAVIAFWNGESHGTKHMIDIAEEKGLNVKVVNYGKF
jgi:predicted Rossmann-fold nucleotide-binding protein